MSTSTDRTTEVGKANGRLAAGDSNAGPETDLDWLIIGGGIHGVHIATRLIRDADVTPDRLRIVDPGRRLLERWHDCTATTGMSHLRSPSVHNLDTDPRAMQRFAGKTKDRKPGLFAAPYERPSLSLFNAHCATIIDRLDLETLQIRSRATACIPEPDTIRVLLSDQRELRTRNVVLAIGAGEQPARPDWASREHPRVHHVFDPGFDGWPSEQETVLVVGGGISAGHVALRLLDAGHEVHMLSRHPLRAHRFDSDPGWLGPKYTTAFHKEPNPDRRRAVITKARHRGSMPPEMIRAIKRSIHRGRIEWHEGEATSLEDHADGLSINIDAKPGLIVDRVLLATGFAGRRPGGALVDDLVASASLRCARCGYPIVDESLRWHPGVFVSGPLAELELGPVSRNIAGARRAAERIVAAAREADGTMKTAG